MPKQINVKLGFEADTSQARKQIADLQKSLDSLLSGSIKQSALTGFDKEVSNAQQSVLKLKSVINNSLNADTGRLDLSKFNTQLNNSGLTLSQLSNDMNGLGADGQKAFLNLANSIVTAQKPMVESNKLLDNMWTALKNTARWQLSSSLLHGFMGALQGAYGYAQDLNKSLTDIAIVTGRSTDQMAAFAEQANKSAQALSVSTTAYTDAALIYYQQGLNDDEVKARTDITMQMSNVTGESAEHVSSYMTAIWNNFAEGSEDLDHFADVITALGAATASSSEEIANGMQQFAAVADTVGLSYEYAATALATVVAQTRQSESTVGNSFRTIFSRLQGLKLGETLEDGTSLNKYSNALATIGVNIKDQNGELKEMDTILNEIGAKWQTLTKDQQVALAQTVGGVRQYTNLIALFDNWDTFQKNLEIANTSDGALAQQAETYAESWEAAEKRVKAAWQGIYQDLINDDFFIGILNSIEKVLLGVDGLIDALGGLPGVLGAVGAVAVSAFGKNMVPAIQNAQEQLSKILKPFGSSDTYAEIKAQETRQEALKEAEKINAGNLENNIIIDNLKEQISLNDKLSALRKSLTKDEFALYQQLVSNTEQYGKQAEEAVKVQHAAQIKANDSTATLRDKIYLNDDLAVGNGIDHALNKLNELRDRLSSIDSNPIAKIQDELGKSAAIEKQLDKLEQFRKQIGATREELRKFIVDQTDLATAKKTQEKAMSAFTENSDLVQRKLQYEQYIALIKQGKTEEEALAATIGKLTQEERAKLGLLEEEKTIRERIAGLVQDYDKAVDEMDNEKIKEITMELSAQQDKLKAFEDYKNSVKNFQETPTETEPEEDSGQKTKGPFFLQPEFAKNITSAFQGISQLTMGINALSTAWGIFNDKNLDPFEKITKSLPSVLMGLPALVSGFSTLGVLIPGVKIALDAANGSLVTFFTTLLAQPQFWIFIAIAGAIVGIIAALKNANDELHATEIAAEKAAQKADESRQKFDEMKTAFDQLKASLEDHRAAVDALEDLKRGTEEWREAVFNLNQDTLELIKQYPELAKYVQNVNGALTLSEKGMKEFEDKKNAELKQQYNDWIDDQSETYRTDIENKKNTIAQKIYYGQPEYAGTRDNASISDVSKVMELINETNGSVLHDGEEAFISALEEKGIIDRELAQALYANRQEIANLVSEERANITSIDGLKESLYSSSIDEILGDEITEKIPEELYIGPVEDYMAQIVADAEKHGVSAERALLNIQKDFTENSQAYIDGALAQTRQKLATNLIDNGFQNVSQEKISSTVSGWDDRTVAIAATIEPAEGETWDEYLRRIDEAVEAHEIPLTINADDLVNFKGKTEDLQVEVDKLSQFLQKNWEDFDGLSEHLEECKAAADKVAYSFIRFDDAMQDVSKNYAKWKKQLKSEDVLEVEEAVNELRKTYANLLDIDGENLGKDFLKSGENLEYLNQVLNGTEEEAIAAYDALQRAAMISELGEFGIKVNEDSFNSAYDYVNSVMDELGILAGQDLQAGTVEFNQMADALDAMLAMVGDNEAAAQAMMDAMQWSGTLTNQPVEADDSDDQQDQNAYFTEETAQARGFTTDGGDGDDMIMSEGTPVTVSAPSLHYETGKNSRRSGKKLFNIQSYRIDRSGGNTLHYNGGGAPKVRSMPARNVGSGGSGGSCFAAGTKIVLKHSQKAIENIKPGDLVLSYNEKTHRNEFSKVVQTMIHNVYEKIYNLFVKNDKLIVTGNHRFLVIHNGKQQWIPAEDIKINDLVLLSSGDWCKISNIDIEKKFLTVYNFEVSNTHNYYVGENHILAHNKGGGGGGSSKPKKKKVEKKKEPTKNIKEADRYHNIKEKIEDLNTEMKRLNENKDRAYGKDRIKWMDEEIKKTEEQIKLTDEYIDEIKSYAKIDKEDLKNKLGSFISDADFDENGVLKDYEGLLAKIQGAFDDNVTAALNKATAEYNAAVDKFNASDQEDDATEEFEKAKEAWDKAKESYDKEKEAYDERLKSLKQYEDTINLLQEKEQERIDQLNELYDKWLARTTYKVEISLEMNEDDMNYLQWVYDNLGDSADRAADRISLLSKQMKTAQKDIATYKKGIEELFAQNGMDVDLGDDLDGTKLGERLDQLIQKMRERGGEPNIQEVIDKLSEYRDGLMDTYDTMRDLADAATENVVNAYDEWNERLQENLDLMDHYDSVIDTIKEIADLLGEDQLGLGDEQAKAYEQAKLDNQRNAAAIAKDNYDAIAKERERVQKLLETSESETEKKHWEEVLKNLQEAENEAMEEYLSRWRDALRQAEENYQASLARNEKAYQKAMSGGMGTLDMLQEQFDRQKELDDLYLDDYEKYKKLGDITSKINKNLANNPSPMIQEKMKDLLDDVNAKMENGADISEGEATILEKRLALLEAEDQLLAARNAKSAVRMTRDNEGNFSYTYTADTSKIEEAQQNYADKFYELLDYEKQYSDETQGNMLKSWQDFINKRNEILEDDMLSEDERNKAMERLQADYDKMVAYYSDELNMVMEEMSRLKTDDWKDMENILGRLLAGPEDFETDLSKTTLGQLTNAWSDPEGMAKSWRDAADTLYTQDADARAAWVAANEETNRRVDTSTKEFAENYKSTLGEIVEASDEVAESAEKMAEEMPKAMTEVLNEAENFFNEFGSYIDTLFTNIQNIVKAINDLKDVLAGVDPEYRTSILGDKVSKTADYELPVKPVSGATGMYTGEWGTGGKLAILHEKELLLNEADTQNILKAVDFVRNMPQFGGVLNINNNVDYSKLAAVGATDLQQQVHIDASFPNVESHTEIELALNNLINSASQYVNRK